jgi:purine-binding chemotaxis protein CheW
VIKKLLLKKALGKTEEDNKIYHKFILCKIQDMSFLIKIEDIREIVNLMPLTPIPGIEKNILGVLNLRGIVVPVIDIRNKLGINTINKTALSRYIVLNLDKESFALLVDEAQAIIDIEEGSEVDVEKKEIYFNSYVKYTDKEIGILDIKKIFLDYKI